MSRHGHRHTVIGNYSIFTSGVNKCNRFPTRLFLKKSRTSLNLTVQ